MHARSGEAVGTADELAGVEVSVEAVAGEELLVTAFTQMDALQAERLDLKVDRVFMREGKRLARISPSELIGSMGLEVQEAQA